MITIFAYVIVKNPKKYVNTIILKIVFILIYCLVLSVILMGFDFIYSLLYNNFILIKCEQRMIITEYMAYTNALNIILNYLLYSSSLKGVLFTFGMIVSLVARKLDPTKYEDVLLKNENVTLVSKVLSFLIGFLGSLVSWVVALITYQHINNPHPKHYMQTKNLFIVGIIVSIPIKLIVTYLYFMIVINS